MKILIKESILLKKLLTSINKKGEERKMLSPKQMLQRWPIALRQVKGVNTSENLLNKIRQIIYSSYRAKEITKKVYNNIMNSIQK